MKHLLLIVLCSVWTTAYASTKTPIKHVIIIVGENRTFDQLFGVWKPRSGNRVSNLLSKGIVTENGEPGKNFSLAIQHQAESKDIYTPTPDVIGAYKFLPQPYASGAFGQRHDVPDERFPSNLPNGPFQITHSVSYGAHTGDPAHRFFQMWEQVNGGKNDLFVWVANTVGIGPNNGSYSTHPEQTGQGAVAMGFYNMTEGDVPFFHNLADEYAVADNYHQPIMGGTTANYFALATADVGVFSDDPQHIPPPPFQIENPNVVKGTNNFYIQDGYGGGTYVNCSDKNQPGVAGIQKFLNQLPYKTFHSGNCDKNRFYMVNNLNPSYAPDGKQIPWDPKKFLLPPQTMPHIGDLLSRFGVSWKWYSGGRNDGVKVDKEYCPMCDTPTFFKSTMTGPDIHKLQDLQQFYIDVKEAKNFPSVSVIAPYDSISGHPGYSMETGFDELVHDVINRVQSNPDLWKDTAIFVTFDEGGGYYDSGYIQFIDFFGDGPRIPLIAVSPFVHHGFVDHTYYDHASLIKFIEYNWSLPTLSSRSRDNLPNPKMNANNPYIPVNRPAIGDLTSLFDFKK